MWPTLQKINLPTHKATAHTQHQLYKKADRLAVT
jgi:hypothetical protein